MRKPKKLKFPKPPKSKNPEVWERYKKKCEVIKRKNQERERPYDSKKEKIERIKDQVKKIKERG